MIRLFSSLPPWGRLLILAGFCLYFAAFAEGRYRGKSLITDYIVLPRTDYSYDEMDLILRHEVIHLLRKDAQTKMFMLFCRSLLWWYPLMPKCSEMCSQDIEVPAGKLGNILSMPQIETEELKINYLYVDGRITGFEPEEQEKLLGMISDMDVSISERAYKYEGPRIQVDMLWNGRWARVNIERGLIYAVGDELYKGDRIFVHPYWPADENAVKAIVEMVNKKDL